MVRGMTVTEAARHAEVDRRTITRWLAQGLPAERVGREKRIVLSDLQAHMRAVAQGRRDRASRLAGMREVHSP